MSLLNSDGIDLPKLRDYQERIVDELRQAIRRGAKRPLMSAPTGSGKTSIGLVIAGEAAAQGHHTAVMVERVILADHWHRKALACGLDSGIIQAERGQRGGDLTVYSQQTSESRSDKLMAWPTERVVIIDEAHIQRAMVTEWIRSDERKREHPNQIIIGMTATPMVPGLGDTYDALIAGPTTKTLTEAGWLVPVEVWQGTEQMDMEKYRPGNNGEWRGQDVDEETAAIVGDIAREWARISAQEFYYVPKTIVFSSTVASGKRLVEQFNALGLGVIAAQVSYRDSRDEREKLLYRYENPGVEGEIFVLVNVSVVGRGFDVPEAKVLVDASPYRSSFSSYAQMVGRVLRPAQKRAQDGERAIVLDHCGNFGRFFPDWHVFFRDGVAELLPDRPPDEDTTAWECPECEALNLLAKTLWVCRKCGVDVAALREAAGDPDAPLRHVRVWSCERCSAPNRLKSVECTDCGMRRPDKSGGDNRPGWECPECGGQNPLAEYRCGHRNHNGERCSGEKEERVRRAEGKLEKVVHEDPVGVDIGVDMRQHSGRKYAWIMLFELALRNKMKRRKIVTEKVREDAKRFAAARYQALFGAWPPWPPPTAREPEVDPRLAGWWEEEQKKYRESRLDSHGGRW